MRTVIRALMRIAEWPPLRALLGFPAAVDRGMLALAEKGRALADPVVRRVLAIAAPRVRRAAAAGREAAAQVGARLGPPARRGLARVPWSCWLGLMATGMACVAIRAWDGQAAGLAAFAGFEPSQIASLRPGVLDGIARLTVAAACLAGALSIGAALLAFVRIRLVYRILQAAAAADVVLVLVLVRVVWGLPALLYAADSDLCPTYVRNELWVHGTLRVLPLMAWAALLVLLLGFRAVQSFYGFKRAEARLGDRIWENLRTHGRDPAYRTAVYQSSVLHVLIIVVVPFLLARWGCMEQPYGIPLGSGTPVIEVVKIKRVKKKPEKKYVFNLNSAISFYIPKIEDSEVFDEVEKETENQYEAQKQGKLGAGGGKEGGWPNGMENARVRFIRLQYDGGDWDQDMGFGADYNMLLQFHKMTGFNVWPETESIRIIQLTRFPKNRAPPFVYLTGGIEGGINVSQSEVKILRHYCLDMGGMIFADNGGRHFDRSFRALMRRVFPELPLVDISRDDIMFQQPFLFPNGAPPMWHHSGNAALGVRSKGRWVVFYHQGDINDAWKTGHSGASDGVALQAYKMGINVINYSFNQYMQINFGGQVAR